MKAVLFRRVWTAVFLFSSPIVYASDINPSTVPVTGARLDIMIFENTIIVLDGTGNFDTDGNTIFTSRTRFVDNAIDI